MDTESILALIADFYKQILNLQQDNIELKQENEDLKRQISTD